MDISINPPIFIFIFLFFTAYRKKCANIFFSWYTLFWVKCDLDMFSWDWQTQEYFIDLIYFTDQALIYSQFLIMSIKDIINFFFPKHTHIC